MKFNAVLISVLVSILILESQAEDTDAKSKDKQEVEPAKPDVSTQKNDVIKDKTSFVGQSALINATASTAISPTTDNPTGSTPGRHIPKRCHQHPEKCHKGTKSERLASRERKREEKRRIKEEKKRQKEYKRAEKIALKEKRKQHYEHKSDHDMRTPHVHNVKKGTQKYVKASYKKEIPMKQNFDPMSNSSSGVPPPKKDSSSEEEDSDHYYYDYESDKSDEGGATGEDSINIEKRSRWNSSNRKVRNPCHSDSNCATDECCIMKVNGDKVCSKKDFMREGRRCVDTCTCIGELQCYRPNIRNARTGDLTPRREHIGRCTTKKEVDVNDGVVLPRPNDSIV